MLSGFFSVSPANAGLTPCCGTVTILPIGNTVLTGFNVNLLIEKILFNRKFYFPSYLCNKNILIPARAKQNIQLVNIIFK